MNEEPHPIRRQPTSKQDINNAAIEAFKAIRQLDTERVVVLSFRGLQLKRIGELQDQLFAIQEGLASEQQGDLESEASKREETKTLDDTLQRYAEALRSYETLSQNTLPFIPPGSQLVGRLQEWTGKRRPKVDNFWARRLISLKIWLAEFMPKLFPWFDRFNASKMSWYIEHFQTEGAPASEIAKEAQKKLGPLGFRELDKRGREKREEKTAFTRRLLMGLFGGVALITPMLIMVLHPSQNVSLITTSIATVLFALLLAFWAHDSSGKDVLGATAAYAAVLVVFVGTSAASTTPATVSSA